MLCAVSATVLNVHCRCLPYPCKMQPELLIKRRLKLPLAPHYHSCANLTVLGISSWWCLNICSQYFCIRTRNSVTAFISSPHIFVLFSAHFSELCVTSLLCIFIMYSVATLNSFYFGYTWLVVGLWNRGKENNLYIILSLALKYSSVWEKHWIWDKTTRKVYIGSIWLFEFL